MSGSLRLDTPAGEQLAGFLRMCFGGQSGWLCLGWIDGDPQVAPLRETWFELPRQFGAALQCAQTLADCQYNLYAAPCLFSTRKRSYETALPSRWLWFDDTAIDGAMLIESSPGNFQSWLPLDRPLGARERSQLQRGLRNASAGADACSADAVHLARLPGGWNRKRQMAWRVRLEREVGPAQSADELSARFPAAEAGRAEVLAGDWSGLPPGEPLAQSQRLRALARANEQLGRLLADEPIGLECGGRHDSSRSARRAIFVRQLLRARYPHAEIRALALQFASLLDSGRGVGLFQRDIDRLLAKYTPAEYTPEPTRAVRVCVAPDRPLGGRPITITAEALLEFYHQHADCGVRGIVLEWTRAEIARRLGVSVDTIQRREGELLDAGRIRREISADRQHSFVVLSPATWDVYAQPFVMRSELDGIPERAVPGAGAEKTHPPAGGEPIDTAAAETPVLPLADAATTPAIAPMSVQGGVSASSIHSGRVHHWRMRASWWWSISKMRGRTAGRSRRRRPHHMNVRAGQGRAPPY